MGKENTPFRGHSGRIDVSVPNALAARAHESLPGRRLGPLPPWLRYVVGGSAAALVYLVIPSSIPLPALVPRLLLYQGVSASAVVALVVGVRRHRPSNPTPWYLLIAGQAIYLVADLTFSTLHDLLHSTAFPSPADLLYLGHYPLVIVAVLQLARSRSRGSDRESLIDGSIIAIGVGVLSLVFLIEPAVAATEQPLLTRSAAAAYPIMDMLVLAVAARLSVSAGLRTPAAIIVQAFRGDQHDTAVLAVACTLLFLLVIYRMSGLIRQVETSATELRGRGLELQSALSNLEKVETERKHLLDRTMRGAEEERSRIAAELHDGPIQRLTAIGY